MKKCSACKEQKDVCFFGNDKRRKDGLTVYCKNCSNEKARQDRVLNFDKWEVRKKRNTINRRIKVGVPLDTPYRKPKGSLRINYRGYMERRGLKWMNHPCSDKFGRILEHRRIMYDHLGRAPLPGENIHHKNGITTDNRIENLEIWSTKHPSGQRVSDKISWAIEFLTEYGYTVTKNES